MTLDPFDYKEPGCAVCDGEDFYNYDPNRQSGSIPINNIIEKLDSYLNKEKYEESRKLLDYWINEAKILKDLRGELSIQSEVMGLSRKITDKKYGLSAVERGFEIIRTEKLEDNISTATIWLNGATTMKAFGETDKSIEYYKKAEDMYNKKLEKYDSRLAGLYNNMGLAYVDMQKYDIAYQCYIKAIDILEHNDNRKLDEAITYVNMAEMYERENNDNKDKKIDECMDKAYELLNDTQAERNGYYAYVCRKCAPSFGYYGYFLIRSELDKRADEIYERNRTVSEVL